MIGQTLSRSRILEKLSSGGLGVVCKAEDTKLQLLVALKSCPESSLLNRKIFAKIRSEALTTFLLSSGLNL